MSNPTKAEPDEEPPLLALARLTERLRRECPWDREQTPDTLKTYLLEECYEVLEALDAGDPGALREELGDLLFQVFFLATLAREHGWFDLDQVASDIGLKMQQRHPHVFGGERLSSAGEVKRGWETRKRREQAAEADPLASVPASLPALAVAFRQASRAADLGFDWEKDADVAAKIEEELAEWREAESGGDRGAEKREIGDLLLAAANLARRRGVNPEDALRESNARFRNRFAEVSRRAAASGREISQISMEELDRYWEEAKAEE